MLPESAWVPDFTTGACALWNENERELGSDAPGVTAWVVSSSISHLKLPIGALAGWVPFAASFGLPSTVRLTVKPNADWPAINPSNSVRKSARNGFRFVLRACLSMALPPFVRETPCAVSHMSLCG